MEWTYVFFGSFFVFIIYFLAFYFDKVFKTWRYTMVDFREIVKKIKYRFSIENISVNDCVIILIICGYALFFLVDAAFPFNNLPMSFLLLTIILFSIFLLSQYKKDMFEKPLNEIKKRKYEEKTREAQNAYKRYLRKEQERIAKEREYARNQAAKNESVNKEKEKDNSRDNQKTKGPFEDKKNSYSYYSDYSKYYEYKSNNKGSDKKESSSNEQNNKAGNDGVDKTNPQFIFFKNCSNTEQVEKTYKKLCQIYHPDQSTGNNEMFIAIKEEYELAKKVIK